MNEVYDWFYGLATIGGFAYFLLGFASYYLYCTVKMKIQNQEIKIPWHLAGIAIGTVAIVIVTVQSSNAYNIAKETALQARQCQREFNTSLQARAKIAEENDELSRDQRGLFAEWQRAESNMWVKILNPPGNLADLETNDPRRQEFSLSIVNEYSRISNDLSQKIYKIQDRQEQLAKDRSAHPLPEGTCGRQ